MMVMTRLIMMMMTRLIIRIEAPEFDICTLHPTIQTTSQLQKYHFAQCLCVMNYSSLVCLDDFQPNTVSENLRHRFILCKLRWKLRVRGKFDWQVLEYLVRPLLLTRYSRYTFWFCSSTTNCRMNKSKIFKLFLLRITLINNKPPKSKNPTCSNKQRTEETNQPTNKTNKQTEQLKGTDLLRQSTCSRRQALILEEKIKNKHFFI